MFSFVYFIGCFMCPCTFCYAVLPRLDTNPQFVANSETWIKIRWFRWNGMIEPPLSLLYQVEYQPSDSSEDSEWLRGPLVQHDISSQSQYIEALIRNLTRNTYYDFRIHPLLRGANGQYTNASASPRSSPCRTRCSGICYFMYRVCLLCFSSFWKNLGSTTPGSREKA